MTGLWVKLAISTFDSPKIKLIASMPEGDAILVIWIRLLCLAGQVYDEGKIYLSEGIPYTDEMLAVLFGKPAGVVRMALKTFASFGMLEILEDGTIFLTGWEKYQSTEKADKVREQTKERTRRWRERKKLEEKPLSSVTVTEGDAPDKDRDTEQDKEEDKECGETGQEQRTRAGKSKKVKLYGKYRNVALSDEEYEQLRIETKDREYLIEDLSAFMESTGRRYQNHYATLLRCEARRKEKEAAGGAYKKRECEKGPPSYDIEAFEKQGFELF